MKRILLIFASVLSLFYTTSAQSVGIGTATPNASAQLDISSNNKGMLIPRLTTAQRDAIAAPVEGLMVYSITDSVFYVYKSRWKKMSFRLPYTDSLQTTQSLFHIVSNGSGFGIMGENRNNSVGVVGITQNILPNPSFFPIGVYGANINTGSASGSGVYGEHLGSGIAVNGFSENGTGGKFVSANGTALQTEGSSILKGKVAINDDASSAHPSAALDIKSTAQGVLFPKMTTAQKIAIANPANGLHVFDTDERSLNFYDSLYGIWNCYSDECKTEIITISSSICKLDFYNVYAKDKKANKYLVIIQPGVNITGCLPGDTAINFANMPGNAVINIRNYGTIAGAGGNGGNGRIKNGSANPCPGVLGSGGTNGRTGGSAIGTKTGVSISVINYGIVSGGGGGGGAGAFVVSTDYGGGGGGGAGSVFGNGGDPGISMTLIFTFPFGCQTTVESSPGLPGTSIIGGLGGAGSGGGGTGGIGGVRGQQGAPGSDNVFVGGAAGKAIAGGSGNMLTNVGSGQSFGIVD